MIWARVFAFAAPFLFIAAVLAVLGLQAWLDSRAYRRRQKWIDGMCQGEPPK
jgi:hypothetical protein